VVFIATKVLYNFNNPKTDMLFWNVNLKALTLYRIDAIYYGVLAAYVSLIKPSFWRRYRFLLLIIGGGLFLGLNVIIPTQQIFIESHPFFWNVLYLPINSIAIAFTLPLLSQIKSAPKLIVVPITIVSVISYSMYLIHYSVVLQLMKHFFPTEGLSASNLIAYLSIYVIITLVGSYALYAFFERPMTNLRDTAKIKNRFK
jgi:peptidoglycan/LPS O-acetylase OafA/YrhL